MTVSTRLRWTAAALVAAAVVAVIAELALVDREELDATVWGGGVAGVWAAIGIASAAGLTLVAAVVGRLLRRERDPYDGAEDDGG